MKTAGPRSKWRTISEFPNYQINANGDLRNRFSHKEIAPMANGKGLSYRLTKSHEGPMKTVHLVSVDDLLLTTFPKNYKNEAK